MRVHIKNIPEEGLEINKTLSPEELDLYDDDFSCLSPIEVSAKMYRADDAVVAKVFTKGKFGFPCARCLAEVERQQENKFDLVFEVDDETDFINLGEDIRQELRKSKKILYQ